MKKVLFVLTLLIAVGVARANFVEEWKVGSGQINGNFTLGGVAHIVNNVTLSEVELGLRPQERYVGPSWAPTYVYDVGLNAVKGVYQVEPGYNGSGAIWNFDVSVYVTGVEGEATRSIDDLQSLTLSIDLNTGNGPTVVDLLNADVRSWLDAHTTPTYIEGTPDPTHFYQGSENLAWSGPAFSSFDADAAGTYTFVLTAVDADSNTVVTAMDVVVVPEPATLALLGLGGLLLKRKK